MLTNPIGNVLVGALNGAKNYVLHRHKQGSFTSTDGIFNVVCLFNFFSR